MLRICETKSPASSKWRLTCCPLTDLTLGCTRLMLSRACAAGSWWPIMHLLQMIFRARLCWVCFVVGIFGALRGLPRMLFAPCGRRGCYGGRWSAGHQGHHHTKRPGFQPNRSGQSGRNSWSGALLQLQLERSSGQQRATVQPVSGSSILLCCRQSLLRFQLGPARGL